MTYKFACNKCHKVFIIKESMRRIEQLRPLCKICDTPLNRVYTPAPVHYKGTGFYTTDYKGK